MRPEHIEKIVTTFEAFADVRGYAAVVSRDDLVANDFNLNIRRYADNSPPPEPHDVRAHLQGGIPKAEVAAKQELFTAHGFDPMSVRVTHDHAHFQFVEALTDRGKIKGVIESHPGVLTKEARLRNAVESWWKAHEQRLVDLPKTQDLMAIRAEFLESYKNGNEVVHRLEVISSGQGARDRTVDSTGSFG